ncbi:AGE family epimerase/isomerase [Pelagicoccus mobilis]|uniref:AGE family epimerase/isomerase n=1 Tax=Pelagicoccus mobilis TaxID=415221 RepID=A0A934RXZ8_9BACT|nr:AGE family epimerase/isomerase [Pelagicoccus mobilis]
MILLSSFLISVSLGRSQDADRLVLELEASFQRDIVEAWYPKVVDREYGGFLTTLDEKWRVSGNQNKFIVTQSRHVWVLARLSIFLDDPEFTRMAIEGARFLNDAMWDPEFGGYYELVDRTGAEVLDRRKSAYGMSFAIYALSNLYEASGEDEVLAQAKRAFNWMETFSWDSEFGAYVNSLEKNGDWALSSIDGIDTKYVGLKDYNSSIHMLECLTSLYRVWPDERVRERLDAMRNIVRDRFVQDKGYLHFYFTRDWQKLSLNGRDKEEVIANFYTDHVSWGHDVETAFLLLEASHALEGEIDPRTLGVAKSLVDHALETGWDDDVGSLFYGGYYFDEGGPCAVIRPEKEWWVAAEGMNAFLLMAGLFPEEEKYQKAFDRQWSYIKRALIDPENGGWRGYGLDGLSPQIDTPKAHVWKASYHDARSYMNCLEMLRGEFPLLQH